MKKCFDFQILNSTEDFKTPHAVEERFSSGDTSQTCKFFVEDDTEPEGDEIYAVQLAISSGRNVKLGVQLAYIKITANDDGNGVVGFDVVSHGFVKVD